MTARLDFITIKKISGMTEIYLSDTPDPAVPLVDFYIATIPVDVWDDVAGETDGPVTQNFTVRVQVLADDEPFQQIAQRAKDQLRTCVAKIMTALDAETA